MSAAPKPLLTPAEYLARERTVAFRSEFYRGQATPLPDPSVEWVLVSGNLMLALAGRLNHLGVLVLRDTRLKVPATGLYAYPDLMLVCETPDYDDAHRDTLLNPRVVIELSSIATARTGARSAPTATTAHRIH